MTIDEYIKIEIHGIPCLALVESFEDFRGDKDNAPWTELEYHIKDQYALPKEGDAKWLALPLTDMERRDLEDFIIKQLKTEDNL